jgi:hypothetical protein
MALLHKSPVSPDYDQFFRIRNGARVVEKLFVRVPPTAELLRLETLHGVLFELDKVSLEELQMAMVHWRGTVDESYLPVSVNWQPCSDGRFVPIPVLRRMAGPVNFHLISGIESVAALISFGLYGLGVPVLCGTPE